VDRQETITGTVAAFMCRNPHSFVQIMAPDKTGTVQRWLPPSDQAVLTAVRVTSGPRPVSEPVS